MPPHYRPPHPPAELVSPSGAATTLRDTDTMDVVRRAIARQDVVLAFQPVISPHRTGAPAFYEGLVRILDETGRIIPARHFIPAVEATGLGRDIDCLALEMALYSLARDPSLRLAVNISARSIDHPRWRQILEQGLGADLTAAERLILEISERSTMQMPEAVMQLMVDLQPSGVSFALDDFGASHAFLRHLRDFMFDILKIDGQFIHGIARNPDNRMLTSALIDIARHFDMLTLAEGVECAEDSDCLIAMGIDGMQGYFYGAATLTPPWDLANGARFASA